MSDKTVYGSGEIRVEVRIGFSVTRYSGTTSATGPDPDEEERTITSVQFRETGGGLLAMTEDTCQDVLTALQRCPELTVRIFDEPWKAKSKGD